ncbi:MAG: universal stress protein [Gammaproteobacteria bacterium]|nr:universal stress protein [Gammaproteobacteria bacterium]
MLLSEQLLISIKSGIPVLIFNIICASKPEKEITMYQKIVAALDFSENNAQVLSSALKLANNNASNLHLIHVVQPITEGYALNVYSKNFLAIEEEALESATEQLSKIAEAEKIPSDQIRIIVGDRAGEIRKLAEEIDAEVIVIGSHGYSGQKRLLGATANKLLHGAKCDILTVHASEI